MSNIKQNDASFLHETPSRLLLNNIATVLRKKQTQISSLTQDNFGLPKTLKKPTSYAYFGNFQHTALGTLPAEMSEMFAQLPYCSREDLVDCITALTPELELLLVDIDALGDTTEAVETLTRLRLSQPQIVLIILSRHFLVDDIDQHRISICDAALRVPVTRKRFDTALGFAKDTNRVWRNRVANNKGATVALSNCSTTLSHQS